MLAAAVPRFPPACMPPETAFPIASGIDFSRSLPAASRASNPATPAAVVAPSAGPRGASAADIVAILACIPAATAPAAISTGEPGRGIGVAAAGGGVAECSMWAATVEAAASKLPGWTWTGTSAIRLHPVARADHSPPPEGHNSPSRSICLISYSISGYFGVVSLHRLNSVVTRARL